MTDNVRSLFDLENASSEPVMEATDVGLTVPRRFTRQDRDPYDLIEWTRRSALIANDKGEAIFRQDHVEAPADWSDMAVNVVVSRYFRGRPGTPERESSIRDLIKRVADTISEWGANQAYFASKEDSDTFRDELAHLLLSQKAAFNSPVWFNVGVDPRPQCSACFILRVEDTMGDILDWYKQEGIIFKGGSGSGINVSTLRSSQEPLSGGGTASGPVSFIKAADASAGVIKSGGKTRRAAKMVILDADHPDILPFVRSKALEEMKARILAHAGMGDTMDGEAYKTVAFQNSNHSVRVTDELMQAVENDDTWTTRYVLTGEPAETLPARELFREIAAAAHACGDPGIQFHTAINRMHTCPETGPIRASNPCSEYMSVDNSACNLASLKLTAFLEGDRFDVAAFRHAIDIMITAQEILVDNASYPSEEITRNSRNMRALGLGFADLGGLLMETALPYDSEQGRTWASAIASVMTGEAYLQSARLAAVKGSFEEYEKNREAMTVVIRAHRESASRMSASGLPLGLASVSRAIWDEALEAGEAHGLRNCQTTVLAPTGTVGFMMDCDTTGIEPELALVKYKKLAGGGHLKLVNRKVSRTLRKLGYESETISRIVAHIGETGGVEASEDLALEHLPVFDCAFRTPGGSRCITAEGHLKMMSAVQPFISGAISKTVNLPAETTVEEIEDVFMTAWKLGLKSITVYRDGCKAHQPLGQSTGYDIDMPGPIRRRLPVDCESVRHKFEIAGQKGYIHVGFYEDGSVGEIFICMAKEGSTVSGLMDTIATLTSIALQYGVPLETLVSKFSHVRFEPSGFTSNPEIPIAKSLTDYIFRYLGIRFLSSEQQRNAGLSAATEGQGDAFDRPTESGSTLPGGIQSGTEPHAFNLQSDAPACHDCGAIMVRSGLCYKCMNCGATNGCS